MGLRGPAPLSVSLTADRTAVVVAEEVAFRVEAVGTRIVTVGVAFGDGVADSLAVQGAREVVATFRHAYREAGEYQVVARAWEAQGETATDALSVRVTAPSGRRPPAPP